MDHVTTSPPPSFPVPKFTAAQGPDPRQERAIRTKALVLTAAAELFSEKGFKQTSVKDVADRMGMTKGAVYFHYPTKEALALAVVEELYERWPALLAEVQEQTSSPLRAAEEIFNRAAVLFRDDPLVQGGARLQIERPLIDAELPVPYVGWTVMITGLLVAARDAGELREGVDPEAAARTLTAAFFGTQHISDVQQRWADVVERWEEVRDLTFYAIRATPSA